MIDKGKQEGMRGDEMRRVERIDADRCYSSYLSESPLFRFFSLVSLGVVAIGW